MIKNFTPRLYQQTILATCTQKNTLVVLPTGMGKTFVFLMLAAYRLRLYPQSKILFIGPTRPLIEQYKDVFIQHFEIPPEKLAVFTGNISPEKRAEQWQTSQIIFSTPQGLENDIINSKISLEDVSLLGIDEAHRATGNYSYIFIAKQYQKKSQSPRIIALTASPGSELDRIAEVCKNLFIEEIEIRTSEDPDVKPYAQEIDIDWIKLDLPPDFVQIQTYLNTIIRERLDKLKNFGIIREIGTKGIPKKELIALQTQIMERINTGENNPVMWSSISTLAEIMKVSHAVELLESQGIIALYNYLDKLHKESYTTKVKAVKSIVADLNFRSALIKTRNLYEQGIKHPKLNALCELVKNEISHNPLSKIIIFNQFRDNAVNIVNELNTIENVRASLFVGQQKKNGTGLSQKEQKQMIEDFREHKYNVLCCTSVGEEGLDIPKVNIVIFYEPVPSAIRHIQRRGRTGRQEKGRVVILMTKKTRDEAYLWIAKRKEKRMVQILASLKSSLKGKPYKTDIKTLDEYQEEKEKQSEGADEKYRIVADYREKGNDIVKELMEWNLDVQLEKLDIADYILSDRVAVEVKLVPDFVNSIMDGRLFEQLKNLKSSYMRPIIIIQGTEDIFSVRNIHPNSIRGMIATILVDYGIPILHTKNSRETASMLRVIAKREQEQDDSYWSMHPNKRIATIKEIQEYVMSSFPGIGQTLSKPLLKEFGSVKNIVNASREELEKVSMIGPKKASLINEVVTAKYESDEEIIRLENKKSAKETSSSVSQNK